MRRDWGFETNQSLKCGCVLLSCNSWRQAQVCMALARASDDPALKQYYEELALKFAQNAGGERDPDNTDAPLPKPDSGNTNRHRY